MIKWVSKGQTVHPKYYIKMLIKLKERVRKKSQWILLQDNALAHNSFSVKQVSTVERIPVFESSICSLDLAYSEFIDSQELKLCCKIFIFKKWRQEQWTWS